MSTLKVINGLADANARKLKENLQLMKKAMDSDNWPEVKKLIPENIALLKDYVTLAEFLKIYFREVGLVLKDKDSHLLLKLEASVKEKQRLMSELGILSLMLEKERVF